MHELLERLPSGTSALLTATVTVLIALLVSRAGARVIRRLARDGYLSPVMAARLQVGRRWLVFAVAGLIVLQATGLFHNAWALLSAVLAAIAIGFFAAWSLLSNATSALIILGLRPFRHGDRVEVVEPTNGTTLGGVVVDINLMYTTLEERGEDGEPATLHVPNSLFFQKLIRTRGTTVPTAPGVQPTPEPFYRESLEPTAPKPG